MKELSIEQKAKAYDEALKVLHKYDGANIMFTQDLKEEMFPELKESDNTDIITEIKNIITYFYGSTKLFIHLHSKEELLAWLEKQGELVNSLSKGLDNAHERIDGLIQKNNSLMEQLEKKQGVQQPAYIKEYDFHGMKFIPKFVKGDIIKDKKRGEVSTIEDFSYDTGLYTHTYGQFPITIQDNYEIIEQNSSWSEADEKNYQMLQKIICDSDITAKMANKLSDWLKYIKDRVQQQNDYKTYKRIKPITTV